MKDFSRVAEKVNSLLAAEGIDISDRDRVGRCLSECVAPTLAKKAFYEMVDNSPFERIKSMPSDRGYHYGILKQDRPKMPEAQLYMVSMMLDSDWAWWDETEFVIGLNKEIDGKIRFVDIDADGNVLDKSP